MVDSINQDISNCNNMSRIKLFLFQKNPLCKDEFSRIEILQKSVTSVCLFAFECYRNNT